VTQNASDYTVLVAMIKSRVARVSVLPLAVPRDLKLLIADCALMVLIFEQLLELSQVNSILAFQLSVFRRSGILLSIPVVILALLCRVAILAAVVSPVRVIPFTLYEVFERLGFAAVFADSSSIRESLRSRTVASQEVVGLLFLGIQVGVSTATTLAFTERVVRFHRI